MSSPTSISSSNPPTRSSSSRGICDVARLRPQRDRLHELVAPRARRAASRTQRDRGGSAPAESRRDAPRPVRRRAPPVRCRPAVVVGEQQIRSLARRAPGGVALCARQHAAVREPHVAQLPVVLSGWLRSISSVSGELESCATTTSKRSGASVCSRSALSIQRKRSGRFREETATLAIILRTRS